MKILPDSLPEGSATPEDLREDNEDSLVIHALLADINKLNGKNVFITFLNRSTAVGHLNVNADQKTATIGHREELIDLENVSSIREI
jgi:hypothetical protein